MSDVDKIVFPLTTNMGGEESPVFAHFLLTFWAFAHCILGIVVCLN